jgi:hypothetical protein
MEITPCFIDMSSPFFLQDRKSLILLLSLFLVHKLLQGLQGREGDAQLSGHHFICSPLHLESLKMLGIRKNRERVVVYV